MGIFSGETIISTAVSYNPLIANKPNLIGQSTLAAILEDRDISKAITTEILGGFVANVDRYFLYGRKTYHHRLPTSRGFTTSVNYTNLKRVLEEIEREPIEVIEAVVDLPTYEHFTLEYLQNNWDWDVNTNKVNLVPSQISPIPDPGTLTYVTDSGDFNSYGDRVTITFEYKSNSVLTTDTVTFSTNRIISDHDYYMVQYILLSNPNKIIYWSYDQDSRYYPLLSVYTPLPESEFPYYPIAILRRNKVYIDSDKETEWYKTTEHLLNIINYQVDPLLEAIKENPDRDKLDDVFFLFSLNVQSQEVRSVEYFYNYFDRFRFTVNPGKDRWDRYLETRDKPFSERSTMPKTWIRIREGGNGSYDQTIGYNYIELVENIPGNLRERFESETIIKPRVFQYTGGGIGFSSNNFVETSIIVFRKKETDTTYSEIRVHGLYSIHHVHHKEPVIVNLENSLKDEIYLAIPLEFNALNENISNIDESYVLFDSLNLTIYAIDEQKTKWYQSENFKLLVQIVMIALTILSLGSLAPATLTVLAILEAIFYLAVYIVVMIAIKYALAWLAEELGAEWAMAIALVALVASMFVPGGMSFGPFDIPFADMLMMASTTLIQTTNQVILEDVQDLQQEQEAWLMDVEEKQEQLEEAQDLLTMGGKRIDLYTTERGKPYFNPNETYDVFFERTVGETNPGVLSLDIIDFHIDSLLMLPDTYDMLNQSGDLGYG